MTDWMQLSSPARRPVVVVLRPIGPAGRDDQLWPQNLESDTEPDKAAIGQEKLCSASRWIAIY